MKHGCSLGDHDVRKPAGVHRPTESLPADARLPRVKHVVLILAVAQARSNDFGRPKLDAHEVARERQRLADQALFNRVERPPVKQQALRSRLLVGAKHACNQHLAGYGMLR